MMILRVTLFSGERIENVATLGVSQRKEKRGQQVYDPVMVIVTHDDQVLQRPIPDVSVIEVISREAPCTS